MVDQAFEFMRKMPLQARAQRTIATILEAAAQLMQSGGAEALNTNRVAERAGFSIGTVYQYFPDKGAILSAIAEGERLTLEKTILTALAAAPDAGVEGTVRMIIEALIGAFRGRTRMRRLIILNAVRRGEIGAAQRTAERIAALVVRVIEQQGGDSARALDPAAAFVLTRAVIGAIRAAVIEESPLINEPRFANELVQLALAFLRPYAATAASGPATGGAFAFPPQPR